MTKNDTGDDFSLCNSIFGDSWRAELKAIDKHEILVKISDRLGSSPEDFVLAEEIFENIKFSMTKYVLHHEYCKNNHIRPKLLLWLDEMSSPANAEKLFDFCEEYL
jgi:hypothetical protein